MKKLFFYIHKTSKDVDTRKMTKEQKEFTELSNVTFNDLFPYRKKESKPVELHLLCHLINNHTIYVGDHSEDDIKIMEMLKKDWDCSYTIRTTNYQDSLLVAAQSRPGDDILLVKKDPVSGKITARIYTVSEDRTIK